MCITAVTDNDQVALVERLAHEIWHEHFTAIIGKAQVEYMLQKYQSKAAISEQVDNGFLYYLIKNNNSYVGYFCVRPESSGLLLSKFYITAAQRGKGLGRKALGFIEKLAIKDGIDKISLTVNKYNSATIEAYKRLGFEITDSMVVDIGKGFVMDDYRMEKPV